jgi:hypothetical protein
MGTSDTKINQKQKNLALGNIGNLSGFKPAKS